MAVSPLPILLRMFLFSGIGAGGLQIPGERAVSR
jgi:hypothetical protein